jgi:NitT/TauT family transport system ATP-binding protein
MHFLKPISDSSKTLRVVGDVEDRTLTTSSERPLLEVRDLGKSFAARKGRPQWVLEHLSFSVREGEFLTIVGPSGAGKTTLLNILAQVEAATTGEIRYQDERIPVGDATVLSPGASRRIGYVTQDDRLLPWRTALGNVLLPLEIQGRLTPATREYAHELIRVAGLVGFEHHYPSELSGGMRKRVALIRTLVYDPPVILMDEPFSAVDAETRVLLQEDLLMLWDRGRKTIVFVTHDIAEAVLLGDRALVLTHRPARVKSECHVRLPRPRDIRTLVSSSAFHERCLDVRAAVRAT